MTASLLWLVRGWWCSLADEFDQPWIRKLNDWTAQAHAHGAKLMGISYGHQMIVQALGGVVGTNPNGSSVSIMDTKLTAAARRYFGTEKTGFTLLYHHNDTVLRMPPSSKGLVEMGGNNITSNNGVFNEQGTVLTFNGHPDYSHSPPVSRAKVLLVLLGVGWI